MIGQTLTHYRVLKRIGSGGMGVVYEAEDLRLGRHVALKVLPPQLLEDPQAVERLKREARAASALNHPHICTIYDIGEQDGQHFIVMELLDGQTLLERIAGRPVDQDQVLDIGIQLADALDAAHSAGVIHRDIKSGNIFISKRGNAKILDFGLAKAGAARQTALAAGEAPGPAASQATMLPAEPLTSPGTAVGTVAYMSPEQALGEPIDSRTDLFSLGAVLYEMATGRAPFGGKTSAAVFDQILHASPEAPGHLNRRVSPELERIIGRALEKDRDLRYQSAADLRAELQRVKRDTGSQRALATAGAGPAAAQVTGTMSAPGSSPVLASLGSAGAVSTIGRLRRLAGSRAGRIAAGVVLVAVVAAVVFTYSRWHRGPALTERDWIVLADIQNNTDDASFDAGLKQALSVQLGQSPFLNIFPEERIRGARGTLALMQKSPGERLTPAVAREVCQREGVKAMLAGSISSFGTACSLTLEATNCATDEVLATAQAEARTKEEVLPALGKAASQIRAKLGESLASIQKYDVPITRATTADLEALKLLSQADALRWSGREGEAVPLLQRAVEVDPDFALAWARLATTLSNRGGDQALQVTAATRAFALKDRVSEPERYYIEGHYYSTVAGDTDKALRTYELWKATYPRAAIPHGLLASRYNYRGEHEKAADEARESIRLDPNNYFGYDNLADAFVSLNRLDDARAVIKKVQARGIDSEYLHSYLYDIAWLQDDTAGMLREVEWQRRQPGSTAVLNEQARAAASRGRLREARAISGQLQAAARRSSAPSIAVTCQAGMAIWEVLVGNTREGRSLADAAVAALAVPAAALAYASVVYALTGDETRAVALFEKTEAPGAPGAPRVVDSQSEAEAALVEGISALKSGNGEKALDLFRPIAQYERSVIYDLLPQYLRGQAYLVARRPADAAAEFLRAIVQRSISPTALPGVLAQLGLARARAAAGDAAASRLEYDKFFALWKDADPDVPILLEAKREYAALGSQGQRR
jgi:tetratricopeptide (TPR) repeat protein/predicted Ser/Thr protein kinase